MQKRFICDDVDDIVLVFNGGEEITLRFDVFALKDLNWNEIIKKEKESIAELCAYIVFIGGSHNNEGFTKTKAKQIVANLRIDIINKIVQEFYNSVSSEEQKEEMNEMQKKVMAQFLQQLANKPKKKKK